MWFRWFAGGKKSKPVFNMIHLRRIRHVKAFISSKDRESPEFIVLFHGECDGDFSCFLIDIYLGPAFGFEVFTSAHFEDTA